MAPPGPQLEDLVSLAMAAFNAGRWSEARAHAAEALVQAPGNYEALQVTALAHFNAGAAHEALPLAEQLVALFPDDAFAWNTQGAVLQVLGRGDEAIAAYRKATELNPAYIDGRFNLARALAAAGHHAEALPLYERVIQAGQRHASVFMLWGSSLLETGRCAEAVKAFQGAALEDPSLAAAQVNLSSAAHSLGDFGAALDAGRAAVRLAPESLEAQAAAALAELQAGDLDAALDGFAKLEKASPAPQRWRFLRALAWPPIVASPAQIAARRASAERALDALIAEPARLADPAREVGMTNFYANYQGFDDTGLQEKVGQAYRLACPALEWAAAHVARPRDRSKRIRLGFLSSNLSNHTIGKLNIGIAQRLDRKRFEVFVLRPQAEADFLSRAFDEAADGGAVALPRELEAARRKAAECELDALFFPDIGMDPFTYYLAFARLARLQFTTWGHPVTTGIPNVDFYVSSRHAEPDDGSQRHYSEKLAVFENLTPFHLRPREPSRFDPRAFLRLGADQRLYVCSQTLYKVHPDFDEALMQILRRDPGGRILFIGSRHAAWNENLYRRFQRVGGELAKRVDFVSALALPDYLALVRNADALLDTFHFSGGISSYECFAMGSPVVTLPGAMMRGRLTHALYRSMGVTRWIARSPEHYVELALELAHGGERGAWREEILAGAEHVTEKDAVVREFEAFIEAELAKR